MAKHILKGIYLFGELHWFIIMDGFKCLQGFYSSIEECLKEIKLEEERELMLIRRALDE